MDSSIQQFITSAILFIIAIAIAVIQAKHKDKMLSLYKMIKKSLLLKDSLAITSFFNPDAAFKPHFAINSLPEILTKRCNQANLGHFDLYLNKAYGKSEIVLVEKNIYYRNIIFFV